MEFIQSHMTSKLEAGEGEEIQGSCRPEASPSFPSAHVIALFPASLYRRIENNVLGVQLCTSTGICRGEERKYSVSYSRDSEYYRPFGCDSMLSGICYWRSVVTCSFHLQPIYLR